MRKHVLGVPTRSDINRATRPQKTARGLKFQIPEVEGFYFLCSEKKALISCAVTRQVIAHLFSHMPIRIPFHMIRLS